MSTTTQLEPAELSAEEQEERAAVCYQMQERIFEAMARGREALWELGAYLYEFNEQNGWTALNFESQSEWLAQPEIGMTKTTFHRLVRRHKELVILRKLPIPKLIELEPSKVDIALPQLEDNKVKLDEVIDDVKTLGARDMRVKYIGERAKAKKDDDDDDVIEGRTTETDDEPISAADVNGGPPVIDETTEKLAHSAGVIDSWFEMGGDRRKAQRHWKTIRDTHPLFHALEQIQACVDGGADAPDRQVILESHMWEQVMVAFKLEPQED